MTRLRSALLATCACAGIAVAGIAPAAAQDRSFSIDPNSLLRGGTATVGTGGIELSKSGDGSFWINFVVPMDHTDNTPITVRVYMQRIFLPAKCVAATQLMVAMRRRAGKTQWFTSAPNVDGIKPVGGVETTTFPAAANTIVAKNYVVRAPLAAPFRKLVAGDGIMLELGRSPASASDTCPGSVFVSQIEVKYTSTAAP